MSGVRSAPRTEPRVRRPPVPALPYGVRLMPWREDDGRAHLVIGHPSPLPARAVVSCVERARHDGYRGLVTTALTPVEQVPFVTHGFTVQERLHLLTRLVDDGPTPPLAPPVGAAVGRARRRDRGDVLALDHQAFTPSWRLGPRGLRDALRATPMRQFRVARVDRAVAGYAITGFDGRDGYLQRLAIRPDVQRLGLGTALVADALRYAWRLGATRAYVNTQVTNEAALALYTRCGFGPVAGGLAVLELRW
jgi:ribosomal protein S18 acetylase RimI-like enzyme